MTVISKHHGSEGAAGLLAVLLLSALVLIFMLTISLQIIINIKNAKILADYNRIYYATEGGLRDARMQLKKEELLAKNFLNISMNGAIVTRSTVIGLTQIRATSTGTEVSIGRTLIFKCGVRMANCTVAERIP